MLQNKGFGRIPESFFLWHGLCLRRYIEDILIGATAIKEDNQTYQAFDLWQATLLKVKRLELLGVQVNGSSRASFQFRNKPERGQLLIDFVNRRLSVEPLSFVDAMKSLKALTQG